MCFLYYMEFWRDRHAQQHLRDLTQPYSGGTAGQSGKPARLVLRTGLPLCGESRPHCVRERDRLLLSPKIRESFFRRSYLCFKAAAEALAQTEYPVFAGISPSAAFPLALSGLNESYEEPHGIYIYSTEHGTLVTLERWLRHAELSQPFYLGGTIYYHC